jgi:hypothetical protein
MKKTVGLVVMISALIMPMAAFAGPAPQTIVRAPDFGNIPLYFVEGRGKAPALYYARASRYTLWLTRTGLVFDFRRAVPGPAPAFEREVLGLEFVGARSDVSVAALEPTDYRINEYRGRDPESWTTGIPTARAVLYQNVYDGIDLKVYGSEKNVEYDWIIHPGAKPDSIRLAASGGRTAYIDAEGRLVAKAAWAELGHDRPRAYQEDCGRRVEIDARFEARGDGEFGLEVGPYDQGRDLVLDPVLLAYSTYLGGSGADYVYAIGSDSKGAIYVNGLSLSADFPTKIPAPAAPRCDVYVTKIAPEGNALAYTFFFAIGIFPCSNASSMAVAPDGAAYVCGLTSTSHFPVKKAFQPVYGGGYWDGFVLKIASSGKNLVYSSFIGGKSGDQPISIAVDAKGSAYLFGQTDSRDFPLQQPIQKNLKGGQDCFIAKVSPDGSSLGFSTFLGGSSWDMPGGIALDAVGSVYVGGYTMSPDFPVKMAVQKKFGGRYDLFLAKLSSDGRSLLYSTFLGGYQDERGGQIAVDPVGNAVIIGQVAGSFPVKKAFQKTRKGSVEAVIAKLTSTGESLVYATYLGGRGEDSPAGLAVDNQGTAYIAGYTLSTDFPLKNAYQKKLKGKVDAFLTGLSADGQSLVFSTYLGGIYHEYGQVVALGPDGAILIGGLTNSLNFPVVGAVQNSFGGGLYDVFISKFLLK